MTQQDILQKTAEYIKQEFSDDSSGHDWWHIYRVWKNAITICEHEKGDTFIVQLAALLHDLDDWKFNDSDNEIPLRAKAWLNSFSLDPSITDAVCRIIQHISFKGANVANKMDSLEGFIVQDADRLDAIGAIGIARAFAYGGYKNRPLYDPDLPPQMHASFEEYKNSKSATINHFYEKLSLLKDMMNTNTAKRTAEQRHEVMVQYLRQFMEEWEGKDVNKNAHNNERYMKSIETERLILRLEAASDFDSIYTMLTQIYPSEHSPAREGLQDEQNFYMLMRNSMFSGLFGRWIVKQKTDGMFIGLGMLLPHLCTPAESAVIDGANSHHRTLEVEIGWALARPYRKLGYGTETAHALLKYAFDDIGLKRVIGTTDTENPESIQMMHRLGMKVLILPDSTKVLGWLTTDQP